MARISHRALVEPVIPSGGIAPPKPDFFLAAEQNAPQNTYLVQILERPDPQTFLKVAGTRLRPDWEWSRAGWALAQPKQMWNPLANLPDAAEEGSGDAAGGVVLSKSPRKDQGMMASSFVGEEGDGEAAAAGGGDAPRFRSLSAPPISTALVRLDPEGPTRKRAAGSSARIWCDCRRRRLTASCGLAPRSKAGSSSRRAATAQRMACGGTARPTAKRTAASRTPGRGQSGSARQHGEAQLARGEWSRRRPALRCKQPRARASHPPSRLRLTSSSGFARGAGTGAMAHPRQWARVGMGIEVRLPRAALPRRVVEGELLEMTNQSGARAHPRVCRTGRLRGAP